MKSLKILLTNQSGCFHPGIVALAKVLSGAHQVIIAAPLRAQYSRGHALTTRRPVRVAQYSVLSKVKFFSVDGTPCDSVALAMDKLVKSKPDLVIAGIDPDINVGEKIYSSGVVSAAVLGTMHGVKSISISASVDDDKDEKSYVPLAKAFLKNLVTLVNNIPPDTTLNINFPKKPKIKDIKFTHLTCEDVVSAEYTHEVNPFGQEYYWMKKNTKATLASLEKKGDIYWLKQNRITVTPLKYDLTSEEGLKALERSQISL